MIRYIARCDGCGKEADMDEAKKGRWLRLARMWAQKIDWEVTDFIYCSLACLASHQGKGERCGMGVIYPRT